MILIADNKEALDEFMAYVQEVVEYDHRPFRKMAKELTTEQIADKLIAKEIQTNDIICFLTMERLIELGKICDARGFEL